MEIIETLNLEEARRKIDKLAKERKKAVVLGQAIEFNRKILENKKVSMLILNHKEKNDKLKQRDSGLNQVLCNLAYDNNIEIGIDFRLFNDKNPVILAKIIQNIKLCKKYDVKIRLVNSKGNKHDLFALMLSLGASTSMAKYAVENKFNL